MSKICRCANCGHCILEMNGRWVHVTGGSEGKFDTKCPICGCENPQPNLNDVGNCESFKAYRKYGLRGDCQ